jgi:glycerate-2-kinase
VICLWSGGGSALLADHPENSSQEEMALLNEKLVRCGADINEINAVRKHLSGVKGGQLASKIKPAAAVTILFRMSSAIIRYYCFRTYSAGQLDIYRCSERTGKI